VPGPNPPPGYTGYETPEECEANCEYLGVFCDPFQACLGPSYGPPGSPPVGPATCLDCRPSYVCDGGGGCGGTGYYDINDPAYVSEDECIAACVLTNTGCDPATGECYEGYGLGYANAGGCPGCTACHVCDNVNGWTFVAFREGDNCTGAGELNSSFDPAGCKQWVECDPFNGCSDLGYTLSLGMNPVEGTCADGVCELTNTGCDPATGECYEGYGAGYANAGGCPDCSLTNTGCDPATGTCDQGYGAGYANAGGCPDCTSSWGPYVCRKQTLQDTRDLPTEDLIFGGAPTSYYICLGGSGEPNGCNSNPSPCDAPDYPHHCNRSGDCGELTLPDQCDGWPLDSTTTYVSECYNVNSCSECQG